MIKKFVDKIIEDKTIKAEFSFGIIPKEQVEKIKTATGFDLNGYERKIDNSGINHVFKRHSNIETEKKQGQIAITINDFENIEFILENSIISYEGKNKRNLDVILYKTVIKDELIYYMALVD